MVRYKSAASKWMRIAGVMSSGFLVLAISISVNFSGPVGPGPASADSHYGILDQQAPELDLESWIDGNGKVVEPFKLADYQGKVIYLYFFQDW